jgi:hypothetical protein
MRKLLPNSGVSCPKRSRATSTFEIRKRFKIRPPPSCHSRRFTANGHQYRPDVHAKALIELFRSGATVNVHSGQSDQRRVIDFYGEHVLPKVHAQLKEV